MHRIAWALLVLFIFTIPWEYSLVMPAPLGNVARMAGLLVLAATIPAVLQTGRLRTPSILHWLVLALYIWWCCTAFWTIDAVSTEATLRGYFQEMLIVWLLWEFTDTAGDLLTLLHAWLAGTSVLALLTLANFVSAEAMAAGQVRFVAFGQDPNDVARFLDMGLPLAALLVRCEKRRATRLMSFSFLPVGTLAVLLTGSRTGFVGAIVALAGCALVLGRGQAKVFAAGVLALPAAAVGLWLIVPTGTLYRLTTIPAEILRGSLNQRLNIWSSGWSAFLRSPLLGTGAGTFVSAAQTAPIDTAHNTMLSIAVTGGLCAVFLALAIGAVTAWSVVRMRGNMRVTLATALALLTVTSLAATVEESRTTWLLLGLIAVSARLSAERPGELDACFDLPGSVLHAEATSGPAEVFP